MIRVFTAASCQRHRPPGHFPECPERLEGVLRELGGAGLEIVEVGSHLHSRSAVLALHDETYLERFRRSVERGDGLFDSSDNPISEGSWEAAWGAVDATLAAADWQEEGADRLAFAAVRPPGHHAERSLAMGFCFFGNVAVGAEYLRSRHGRRRVAILDFDVHHGNGTQHLLETSPDVLYVSTHQFPFYPGTGAASERGVGPGLGATVNVPLPAGSDDDAYRAAFEEQVLPALARFAPERLILSAGFDAWQRDLLGGMKVSEAGFAEWGRSLGAFAREHCDRRVLVVLEGGYDLTALPRLVAVHLEGLAEGLGVPFPGPR